MTEHGITPVFVLGLQRTGTTLAANLLAAHPDIAAVAAAHHHGVHESVFFSHFSKAIGDWPPPDRRGAAMADFLRSEYFYLTGLNRDWARQEARDCGSPAEVFRAVMDAYAKGRNARAWVEKSPHHTLLADQIAKALPNAQFLCVLRGTHGFLRSRLWSYGRRPPAHPRRAVLIARACASNVFHKRYMRSLAGRIGPDRVWLLEYEHLRADPDAALAPFLNRLGLPAESGLRPAFAPNSSFSDEAMRRRALTRTDLALARLCEAAASAVPQALLSRAQRRLARRRSLEFPAWVWSASAGTAGRADNPEPGTR